MKQLLIGARKTKINLQPSLLQKLNSKFTRFTGTWRNNAIFCSSFFHYSHFELNCSCMHVFEITWHRNLKMVNSKTERADQLPCQTSHLALTWSLLSKAGPIGSSRAIIDSTSKMTRCLRTVILASLTDKYLSINTTVMLLFSC